MLEFTGLDNAWIDRALTGAGGLPGERTPLLAKLMIDDGGGTSVPAPAVKKTATTAATSTTAKATTPKTETPTADTPKPDAPTATTPPAPSSGQKDGAKAALAATAPKADAPKATGTTKGADKATNAAATTNAARPKDPDGAAAADTPDPKATDKSSNPTPGDVYAEQLNQRAKAGQFERAIQASTLDAALTPTRVEELRAEQEEFFDIVSYEELEEIMRGPEAEEDEDDVDRSAQAAAPSADGTDGRPSAAAPVTTAPATEPGEPATADAGPSTSATLPVKAPPQRLGSSMSRDMPSNEEQLEFFEGREHWIAPNGSVWNVEITENDEIRLDRANDPSGYVDAGYPYEIDNEQIGGSSPGRTVPGNMAPSSTGPNASGDASPTESNEDRAGLASGEVDEHDHANEWIANPQRIAEHRTQALGAVSSMAPAPGVGAAGAGVVGGLGPRPDSTMASGTVTIAPDGRITEVDTLDSRWQDGSRAYSHETTVGGEGTEPGVERYDRQTTQATDGSSANIEMRMRSGSLAQERDLTGMPEVNVTFTDASGRRITTSTDRPSPRETPQTIDELRQVQDEFTMALGGLQLDPNDDSMRHRIMQTARYAAGVVDVEELQSAVLRGGQAIGSQGEETVQEMGDLLFEDVRERFNDFGLDAADGNDLIERDWLMEDLVMNAYYDGMNDEMAFGIAPSDNPSFFEGVRRFFGATPNDFVPLAVSDDVIAHEFAHRLIQANGGIVYRGDSGAINESIADTMAAAVDEDWIVGEDAIEGGIRDMSAPTTMADYVETEEDNGGVHINSAIPNHAAYVIGEMVGRDALGEIYAETITNYISSTMTFEDLAAGTWNAAVDLYGANSSEAFAVQQAWTGVLLLEDDEIFEDAVSPGSILGGGAVPAPSAPVPSPTSPSGPTRAAAGSSRTPAASAAWPWWSAAELTSHAARPGHLRVLFRRS